MPSPGTRQMERPALWEYALKVLGGRAHSSGEMRQKLARRALHPEDVDDVLSRLKEHGYLNDQRFAETFAAARLENQRLGRTRVISDLRQRRVAPGLAEGSVRKVYQDVNETALIEEWIRKKYRLASRDALFQEDKDLASAFRRLLRAGFRSGDILPVLKRFAKDPGLLDSFEPPEEPVEDE
jgi:regulatory protein